MHESVLTKVIQMCLILFLLLINLLWPSCKTVLADTGYQFERYLKKKEKEMQHPLRMPQRTLYINIVPFPIVLHNVQGLGSNHVLTKIFDETHDTVTSDASYVHEPINSYLNETALTARILLILKGSGI